GLPSHKLTHLGINRTFQVPKPFKEMTVRQNIHVSAIFGGKGKINLDDVLERSGLENLANWKAGALNTGQQKQLGLARALATDPKLLLIDEIGAGLNPVELQEAANRILEL